MVEEVGEGGEADRVSDYGSRLLYFPGVAGIQPALFGGKGFRGCSIELESVAHVLRSDWLWWLR